MRKLLISFYVLVFSSFQVLTVAAQPGYTPPDFVTVDEEPLPLTKPDIEIRPDTISNIFHAKGWRSLLISGSLSNLIILPAGRKDEFERDFVVINKEKIPETYNVSVTKQGYTSKPIYKSLDWDGPKVEPLTFALEPGQKQKVRVSMTIPESVTETQFEYNIMVHNERAQFKTENDVGCFINIK